MKPKTRQAIVIIAASLVSLLFLVYAFQQNTEAKSLKEEVIVIKMELEQCKKEAQELEEATAKAYKKAQIAKKEAILQKELSGNVLENRLNKKR
ncbi:MAG: hypothetical protein OEX22_10660 [Cyclobacteriaceae bacterium]|nr:hypothetical protein [Cyclobacteriaceae bacterium]